MPYRLLIIGLIVFFGYQAIGAAMHSHLTVLSVPARLCLAC